MARIVGSTADLNNPWGPIQYIGSRMLGIATTVVITVFKIPANSAVLYQPGCGRPGRGAILMRPVRRRTHAHRDARRLRRHAPTRQDERVRVPGDQLRRL